MFSIGTRAGHGLDVNRSSGKRRFALGLAGGAVIFGLASCGPGRPGCPASAPVVPGRRWAQKPPEAAGFSPDKLEALVRRAGGTGCIVHGGRMIYEWGDTSALQDAASSTKIFYPFLALKAVERGRIGSLDDHVAEWMPELEGLNAHLDYRDRRITFRHLLSQTSGYGLAEEPGTAFAYNDFATGLLSFVLYHRVYASPPGGEDRVLNGEVLGRILRFEHHPTVLHPHTRPRRLRISARDMARFGLLYLRGGRWGTRRVLREDLFAEQMRSALPKDLPRTAGQETEILETVTTFGGGRDLKNHLGCLGYYWWFNHETPEGDRFLPDAPPGTFFGSGYGGRFALVVVPEHDLVVVWFDVFRGESWAPLSEVGRFKVNALIREILEAQTGPMP